MPYRLLVLCSMALAIVLPTHSATAEERLFEFEHITLDNGLQVVTLEDFSTPIVAAQVWYNVGSKDEDPERQGFAHMFEHMMFRGTERLEPEAHFELIQRVGGRANAFTSFDYTAYVNTVPANQLELVLWLESERLMFLNVDEEQFVIERKVVEEERRQYLNQPYGTVMEEVQRVLFREHPYRWHPIGNIAHLRAATVPELQEFWDYYYVPSNAVLVIVGAVEHAEAQEMAEKYFGWMPGAPEPGRVDVEEPPQEEELEITIEERIGPAPLVGYIYRGAPRGHEDYVPLRVLMGILGAGESSRLNQDLVMDRQLATQVMATTYAFQQHGVFGGGAALMPGRDLDAAAEAIEEHFQRLIDEPVTGRELNKVQNQLRRNLITGLFTVNSRARQLGQTTVVEGDPEELNRQLERIDAVTVEDLQRVAREYIVPERRTSVRVLPNPEAPPHPDTLLIEDEEAAEEVAEAGEEAVPAGPKAGAEWPGDLPAEPPVDELSAELPPANTVTETLDNGLKVVAIPDSRLPYVTMKLGLNYGAWADDPEKPGVASMALSMLTRGTENYTAAELAEKLEYNALSLSGSAEMDVSSVNAAGLADKFPIAMELLAEVVLRPTFPEAEFDILKGQREMTLTINEEDASYVADRALREQIFAGHPYARSPMGELEDLPGVERGLVEAWWREFARPDAAVLYVAGDVEPEDAFEQAREYLGEWEADGPRPEVEVPPLPEPSETRIYLVDRPGSVQSQIRIGQPSITRGHPDYHRSRVFAEIYGGGSGSRLFNVVRGERGLTYGVAGMFRPNRFGGQFWNYTFTQTETTADTVQAVLEVLDGMREDPPSGDELQVIQDYLVGSFPGQIETPSDVLTYEWIIEYNDLPADYLQQAMEGYRDTTEEDLARIASDIIDPDRLAIVVVGEADRIRDSLEAIAPVEIVDRMEEADETPAPAPAPPADAPAPEPGGVTP